MSELLKRHALPAVVFLTGACVLIVEVAAVRVLSPYFGNTIFTFSSVISVILAALSIGYYVGGRLADRFPSAQWFYGLILLSGAALLGFYVLGVLALPALGGLSLIIGPLIASMFLFLVPALVLGTLSPYAVKLQSVRFPEEGIGRVAGTIFFWSTLGSIGGSLLAGFVLIPHFGIGRIFFGTGLALSLLGFFPLVSLGMSRARLIALMLGIVFLAACAMSAFAAEREDALYSAEGVYEKITIHDGEFAGRPARFLRQDLSASAAMFLDSHDATDLAYDYSKYYVLYKVLKPDVRNALAIGGGAYSIPKALHAELPNATIDVAEIEPSLHELAKKYFDLEESSRVRNHTKDGRRFLADSEKKYDFIFSDVYHSLFSVPAHFTTQEFFALAKERLSEDGIFIANVIGDLSHDPSSFMLSEIKTFRSVFPNSYFFASQSPDVPYVQNIIFVGYNSERLVDFSAPEFLEHENELLRSVGEQQIDLAQLDLAPYSVLTDDFAPVEYMVAQMLRRAQ